jgi:hypothetical protein
MAKRLWVTVVGLALSTVLLSIAACGTSTSSSGSPKDASTDSAATDSGAADGSTQDADGQLAEAEADSPSDAASNDASDVTPSREMEDAEDGEAGCNAANCGFQCCGDTCVRSCSGCSAGGVSCPFSTTVANSNGYCVGSCDLCDAGGVSTPVTCATCFGTAQENCAATTVMCPDDTVSGACSCASGDAGECVAPTQVCVVSASDGSPSSGLCFTCGQTGTDGLMCENGKACNQDSGTCSQ